MILVNRLGIVDGAVEAWRSPYREPDKVLCEEDEGRDDAQIAMDGVEVGSVADELVVLDNRHAGDKKEEG